ncbi:MAG: type II toxin-antitoxin system VapC family toxin [Planctomycetota bacterium]
MPPEVEEVRRWLEKAEHDERATRVLLSESPPITDAAAEYARVRASLERRDEVIGANDLLIASIALANDLTLVTHNVNEFRRVPSLRIEDWE